MLTLRVVCPICHEEKFECDVERNGDLIICKDCIERELTLMVFERVRKREKVRLPQLTT